MHDHRSARDAVPTPPLKGPRGSHADKVSPPNFVILVVVSLIKRGMMDDIIRPPKVEPRKWKRCFMMVEVWPPPRGKFSSVAVLSRVGFNAISTGAFGVNCHDLISAAPLNASCTRLIGFTVRVRQWIGK